MLLLHFQVNQFMWRKNEVYFYFIRQRYFNLSLGFNILNTQNRFVFSVLDTTYKLTDPVLSRIRRFVPTFGSIDISPIILILALMFLRNLIFEVFAPSLF